MKKETLSNATRMTMNKETLEMFQNMLKENWSATLKTLENPLLTCYKVEGDKEDFVPAALVKDDYFIHLRGGQSLFDWDNATFHYYFQLNNTKLVCVKEIKEYNKQSLAKAYKENSYNILSQHKSFKDAFLFTANISRIENRNVPVLVFDIEKAQFSGTNVINLTQFVCNMGTADVSKIKAGDKITVLAYDLSTWKDARNYHWLKFAAPGEVTAGCEIPY